MSSHRIQHHRLAPLVAGLFCAACAGPTKMQSSAKDAGQNAPKNGDAKGTSDGGTDAAMDAAIDRPQDVIYPDGTVLVKSYSCEQKKFPVTYACQGKSGLFAEALQKSLWFFHANRCGPQESCDYVQWRGKDHPEDAKIDLIAGTDLSAAFIAANKAILDPDGDGAIDVGGGFHDAGDFIKFGQTQAYSATMLGWSWFEFPEAYRSTGLEGELVYIMKVFSDYFAKNTYLDASGDVVAYAEQVSDNTDHSCGWMPGEVRKTSFCPRKAYVVTAERPAADVTAHAAAALALTSMMVKDSDQARAASYLTKAVALYKFASAHPSALSTSAGGLYASYDAHDELAWAALWLYEATQEEQYLRDVMYAEEGQSWTGWVPSILGGTQPCNANGVGFDWDESHTHCWETVRSGVFVRLAAIYAKRAAGKTKPDPEACLFAGMKKIAAGDSSKWWSGNIPQTTGGFSFHYSWGSGRYNSAAQMVALTYAKYFPDEAGPIDTWAKRQIAYLLGDNPLKTSYMMGLTGLGNDYASHPHHADSHASIYGILDLPVPSRHIVWGALVNGPSAGDDSHEDSRANYGSNEITIDYNASFVAALAAHYALQGAGQCPLPDWPPLEPRIDEFYTRTKINAPGACSSQIEVTMMNETIHPPRYDTYLSARYYFEAKELIDKGVDPSQVTVSIVNDRGANEFSDPVKISPPTPCGEAQSVYYVEFSYEGKEFWGEIARLKAPPTTTIQLGVPEDSTCVWDPSNDWSYTGLTTTSTKTDHVPVYSSGKLIFGKEPPCGEAPLQVVY